MANSLLDFYGQQPGGEAQPRTSTATRPRSLLDAYQPTPQDVARAKAVPQAPAPSAPNQDAGLWSDTANLAKMGIGQLGQGAGYLTGIESLEKAGAGLAERSMQALSPAQQQAMQNEFVTHSDEEGYGVGPALTETPLRSLYGALVSSLPATAAGMGVGGLAAKGLGAAGSALATRGVAGGATLARPAVSGAVGFGAGEGLVSAGIAGSDVQDFVRNADQELLDQAPGYQELIAQGMDPDTAREALAEELAANAALGSGAVVGLLGAPMGAVFGRWMGGVGPQTMRGAVLGGAAGEAAQEAAQSAGEEYIGGTQRAQIDPTQAPTLASMANQAVGGALAGGAMGAGFGGFQGYAQQKRQSLLDAAGVERLPETAAEPVEQPSQQAAEQEPPPRERELPVVRNWSNNQLATLRERLRGKESPAERDRRLLDRVEGEIRKREESAGAIEGEFIGRDETLPPVAGTVDRPGVTVGEPTRPQREPRPERPTDPQERRYLTLENRARNLEANGKTLPEGQQETLDTLRKTLQQRPVRDERVRALLDRYGQPSAATGESPPADQPSLVAAYEAASGRETTAQSGQPSPDRPEDVSRTQPSGPSQDQPDQPGSPLAPQPTQRKPEASATPPLAPDQADQALAGQNRRPEPTTTQRPASAQSEPGSRTPEASAAGLRPDTADTSRPSQQPEAEGADSVARGKTADWAMRYEDFENGALPSPEMYDGLESMAGGTIKVQRNEDGTYDVFHAFSGVDQPHAKARDADMARNAAERLYGYILGNQRTDLLRQHRKVVEAAARSGEAIPDEVLADYPDLRRIATSKAKPVAAASTGKRTRATTPRGTEVEADLALVDAGSLITPNDSAGNVNPDYPASLQPRDRQRATSQTQVNRIARGIRPELLGDTGTATGGAPIVGPDGVVESGNGRTLALQQAYREGGAEGYKQWLKDNAQQFGLTPAQVDGMDAPVLVRRRATDMTDAERAQFTREANQSDVQAMSPAEIARADAERITPDMLKSFAPSEDGNVLAASNRSFVQAFAGALGETEAAGLRDAEGNWTRQMRDRLQSAIFAKAYGSDELLALQAEDADPDNRNIVNGLVAAAGEFARARAIDPTLADGDLDIVAPLVDAVRLIRSTPPGQLAERLSQSDMFSGDTDPDVATLARFINQNKRSAKRLGEAFRAMAQYTSNELNTTGRLLGERAGRGEIIEAATRRTSGQQTLDEGAQGGREGGQQAQGQRTEAADAKAAEPAGQQAEEVAADPLTTDREAYRKATKASRTGAKNPDVIRQQHDVAILSRLFSEEIAADNFGKGIQRQIIDIREGIVRNAMRAKIQDQGAFKYVDKVIDRLYQRAEKEGKPIPEFVRDERKAEAKPKAGAGKPADGRSRAAAGGQIGVNGFPYKGGWFLPSTDAPPGKWRIRKKGDTKTKLVAPRKGRVSPNETAEAPTPFSRSIYELVGDAGVYDRDTDSYTGVYEPGIAARGGEKIRPGVRGELGDAEYTVQELIDLYNRGARWIDVNLGAYDVVAKGTAKNPLERLQSDGEKTTDTRYSRAEPARNTAAAVRAELNLNPRAERALLDSGLVTIVQSASEIPGNHPADVAGAYHKGKVYLVADNIPAGRAEGLLGHELGVHHGLKGMVGDTQYAQIVQTLKRQVRAGSRPNAPRAAREAFQAHLRASADSSIRGNDAALWEETIAYLSEMGSNAPVIRRLLAAVRAFLRRLGLVRQFTAADMAHLARGSVQRIVEGMSADGQPATMYHRVFHGTPHLWQPEPGFPHGRPRLDKIGTGEGAQVYGHGVYLAEAKAVGDAYRKTLAGFDKPFVRIGDRTVGLDTGSFRSSTERNAVLELIDADGNFRRAKTRVENQYTKPGPILSALEQMEKGGATVEISRSGQLYHLDIPDNVIPTLLDWDAKISEQPQAVQDAILDTDALGNNILGQWLVDEREDGKFVVLHGEFGRPPKKTGRAHATEDAAIEAMEAEQRDMLRFMTGEQLYKGMVQATMEQNRRLSGPKAARQVSEKLRDAGIPGNRYLDAGSRDTGDGTRNIVLWDQDVLDRVALLKRNEEALQAIQDAQDATQFSRAPADLTPDESIPADGIEQRNEADPDRMAVLADRMRKTGWEGRPLLILQPEGQPPYALTGSNRLEAAREAGIDEVPVVYVDNEKFEAFAAEDDWLTLERFAHRTDEDDQVKLLREMGDARAADLMQAEIDAWVPDATMYSRRPADTTPRATLGVSLLARNGGDATAAKREARALYPGMAADISDWIDTNGDRWQEAAEGQVGALYSRAGPVNAQQQAARDAVSTLGKRVQELPKATAQALKDASANVRPALMNLMTRQMLVEGSKDVSEAFHNAAREFERVARAMDRRATSMIQHVYPLAQDWAKLNSRWWWNKTNRTEALNLSRLMHSATLAGVDPSKPLPSWATEDAAAAHAELKQQFDGLSDRAKNIYRKARDAYTDQRNDLFKALMRRMANVDPRAKLPDEMDAFVAAIEQRMQSDEFKPRRAALAMLRQAYESGRKGVYFPLFRTGDYYLYATDPDGNPRFSLFKSQREQRLAMQDLIAQGYDRTQISAGKQIKNLSTDTGPGQVFMASLLSKVEAAGLDEDTAQALKDEMWQSYLHTLPDVSIRKAFIHRKGTAGFSDDALQAFATRMSHGAKQIARLEASHTLSDLIVGMKKQARELADSVQGDAERAVVANRAKDYAAGLDSSLQWMMNPTTARWASRLTSTGFVYFLGLTPGAALVNSTQIAVVAYPALGARFGATKAAAAIGAAYKEYGKLTGWRTQSWWTKKDSAKRKAFDRTEVGRMLLELEESGIIDRTQTASLIGMEDTAGAEFRLGGQGALQAVGFMYHEAERLNREVTAIAAYRLARGRGDSHAKATEFAYDMTQHTQFSYENSNRSAWMRGNAMRVVTLFMQYSTNIAWRMARDAMVWANRHKTAEERRVARNELAGIMGATAFFAGAMGLPFVATMTWLLQAAHDLDADDDDPEWSAELAIRQTLRDLGAGSSIFEKGVINTLTPFDLAGRTSLSYLFFRPADRDMDVQQTVSYYLEQAAGPVFGIAANAARGVDLMTQGQTLRGFEMMIPKFARDGIRSARYGMEGATSLRGDPIKDEFSPAELFGQFIGLSPAELIERYEQRSAIKTLEQRVLDRRRSLMNGYYLAWKNGDRELLGDTLKRIRAFSRAHPQIPISGSTIRQSMRARIRYSQEAIDGLSYNKSLRMWLLDQSYLEN